MSKIMYHITKKSNVQSILNKVITNVDDKEFVDDMPMKGSRRDRKALGQLVSTHIAETWGSTWHDIVKWGEQTIDELYGLVEEL